MDENNNNNDNSDSSAEVDEALISQWCELPAKSGQSITRAEANAVHAAVASGVLDRESRRVCWAKTNLRN